MKTLLRFVFGAALLSAMVTFNAQAAATPQGYVDFGSFEPPEQGEFVEINISSSLISLASRLVEKEEPEVSKLLKGLHQVRVNVVGLHEDNRSELEDRVQKVRKTLDGKGWERIVLAKKDGQDASVYMKMDKAGGVQGLAVVVFEGNKQAVFVNIVGDIKPEQISMLGEKLHVEALKKAGAVTAKEKEKE